MISLGSRLIACCKLAPTLAKQIWRHNYVIGSNEYLISTFLESAFPWVYSLQFLFKSTHYSRRYEIKCEWVFFSEHSVQWFTVNRPTASNQLVALVNQLAPSKYGAIWHAVFPAKLLAFYWTLSPRCFNLVSLGRVVCPRHNSPHLGRVGRASWHWSKVSGAEWQVTYTVCNNLKYT